MKIESPDTILKMINKIDCVAGEYYSHWLYWNDPYLVIPMESERIKKVIKNKNQRRN